MKHLKTFFAFMLMAVLSIGQVWAETATYTVTSASAVTGTGDIPDGSSAALTGNAGLNSNMLQLTYGKNAVLTLKGYEGCTITGFQMSMKSNSSKGKGSMTLVAGETTLHSVPDATFNDKSWYGSWSTTAVNVDFTSVMTTNYTVGENEDIVITVTNHGTSNTTNSLYIGSYTITYTTGGGGSSNPTVTVNPTSWDFETVATDASASKVFSVSGSDLEAGTLTLTAPSGYSVSPATISVASAGDLTATNVTVSKNTTTAGTYNDNLTISGCGLENDVEVALSMVVKAKYTVTWNNNGSTSTSQVLDGSKPVFPDTPESCDATSTAFIGWATSAWDGKLENLNSKTVYTKAADVPAVTAAVTYYAVFAQESGASGWILTDLADLTSSDVFVLADASNYALNNDGGTTNAPSTNAITVSNGKITSEVADKLKWNISGNATDGYTFYPDGTTESWLYCNTTAASGSNNNMRVGTGDRKVFEVDDNGYLKTKDSNTARYLSRYDASGTPQDFRGYTSSSTNPVQPKCYKYSAGSAFDYMTTCAAKTCEDLGTPSVNVDKTYKSAKLTWEAVENADKYLVKFNGVNQEATDNLYFDATGLTAETQYTYQVKALAEEGQEDYCDGEFSAEANFTTDATPTAHLTLIDIDGTHASSGDYAIETPFNLPTTAASCAKTFVGWDSNEKCATAPTYALGAEFTFANTTGVTLYAVYADAEEQNETITPSAVSGEADPYSFTIDKSGFTLSANKNSGSNAPTWNSTGNDVRVYATGDITLASTNPMTSIVFNLSAQGLKRLAPITASVGTIATQAIGDKTVTWTGNATSVTFTIGDKADYGSDGSSKAGQLCFSTIGVTVLSEFSNYSTTCAAAPTATPATAALNNIAADGASGTITMAYTNVNTSGVTVALFNDEACFEAFEGGWLTALLDGSKNISYAIEENSSYTDARSAYIKLTAPETNGAASPAVVVIPVTQAKKDAVFASLEDLVASDVPANSNVTVSFSNVVIKEIYLYNSNRRGLTFNIQKAGQDIKIYFNADVPAAWTAGGSVSGTLTNCPWKIYNNAWQLAPASTWAWANLTYNDPPEIASVEIRGEATNKTYIDGQAFNPAGLKVFAIYDNGDDEDVTTYATWSYNPEKLSQGDTEVEVTAEYSDKSASKTITGLTVNPIPDKTIAEFIAAGGTRCYLEGTVSNITNTTFGNFDLTDASGKIYVYGCLTPAGESKKFSELGVSANDKIKVIAEQYTEHNTQGDEAINVVFVSKMSAVQITIAGKTMEQGSNWTIEVETNPAAAVANISYEIKDDGSDAFVSLAGNVITANAVGTATIIASIPAGEGYLANSIEFQVEVVAAGSVANVVILAEYNGKYYALNNEAGTTTVELNNGIVYVPDVATKNEIIWVRAEQNGVATFKNGEKYLKGGSSTTLSASEGASGSYEWNWVETGAKSYYTTDPNASTVRSFLYQSGQGIRNYAVSNIGNSSYAQAKAVEIPVSVKYVKDGDDPLVVDGSTIPDNTGVMLSDGVTLYIDEDKTLDNVVIEAGASVQIGSEQTLEVSGNLVLSATMGGGTSAQILGATNSNISLPAGADVFFDITLGAEGKRAEQWHAFTVPFPVDAINGVYDAATGEKLVNEVNYAIMDYHGDIRAQGKYGWKKFRGIMTPGTFYLMTVDGERATYRFKLAPNSSLVAAATKKLFEYVSANSNDAGWNGVGNPTLGYGKVGYNVKVLNPSTYTYEDFDANETNFVVGTPFFIQAEATETMSMLAASGTDAYAPARVEGNTVENIKVWFGHDEYKDKLTISANEDALNEYQIGKDLVKMTMTNTPRVAQIFGNAYNTKLSRVHAPLYNNQATYDLTLYAPAAGEYTIAAPQMEDADVYLTLNGAVLWNISMSPYTLDLQKGNTEDYGLLLQKHNAPQIATGVDNIEGADNSQAVQKVLLNEHVYILRNGQRYDVTGKLAK